MAGTSTATYQFYKPDPADNVNVATDLNANLDKIDSELNKVGRGLIVPNVIQTADGASWGTGTTEVVSASCTVTLPASHSTSRRLRIICDTGFTADGGMHELAIRWKAGASAGIADAEINRISHAVPILNGFNRTYVAGHATGIPAGQVTFVLTAKTNDAKTGRLLGSATNKRTWSIEDVGL